MNVNYQQLEDGELFELMKSGGPRAEKAFAELYSRHSPRVYAYCLRFMGEKEDARDVYQETFIRFFKSAEDDREMTNIPAFLLTIARNLCVNAKRKEKNHVEFEEYMAGKNTIRYEKDELLNLIKMAIELLPPDYKDVFILREYDGLTYNEIAEVTGESLSNVKVRLFRAKQKVREILAPYMAGL